MCPDDPRGKVSGVMRDHSQHVQVSRDAGVARMLEMLEKSGFREKAASSIEHVPLAHSFGYVLAQDVVAKTDIPNALTCKMDSVAFHWDDFKDLAEGEIPDTSTWVRGIDWQFANTGIAMPKGFDTAIVIEHAQVSDDEQHITIDAVPTERFAGTRQPGSTKEKGDICVKAGCIITADVAASISSAGYSSIDVVRKPRVSFLPTGNELVPANLPFSESAPGFYAGYGHVFESNSVLTRGKVAKWGGEFVLFDIVPDEYEVIKANICQAVKTSDIVVLNAGSSKGSDDWSVEVLDEIGEMVFHQVSHGPGHHSFAAVVDGTPVIGISGPPGGASFTLGFYLYPVMREWLGLSTQQKTVKAKLVGEFGKTMFGNKGGKPEKPAGEKRPPEADKPGDKFTSVRFVELGQDDAGTLTALPIERAAANAPGAGTTAIYMMESGPGAEPPQPGDMIEVELRP